MNTIQYEFGGYKKAVLTKVGPQSVQMIETRRAFYAGAAAVLKIMAKISEDDVTEEVGAAILEGLSEEVIQFSTDIGLGKA